VQFWWPVQPRRHVGLPRCFCPSVATSATWPEGFAFYQLSRLRLERFYRSPAVALQMPETRGREKSSGRVCSMSRAQLISRYGLDQNEEAAMDAFLGWGSRAS
jgi:hypothetical protein